MASFKRFSASRRRRSAAPSEVSKFSGGGRGWSCEEETENDILGTSDGGGCGFWGFSASAVDDGDGLVEMGTGGDRKGMGRNVIN